MRTIKTVAVIGLGALGCAYSSKLYEANPMGIKIIANKERSTRYKEAEFLINGKKYDFTYADPEEKSEPADLIIVTVKTHQLLQAVRDMKHHVGENTVILSLLNGITSEEIIGREYGMDKMLYSVSYGLTPNRQGNQIHFTGYGTIAFG